MPEDDKSGTASDKDQPSPQLSEADVEKIIGKVFDSRVPGLMSSFQKQVNQALESRDDVTANDDDDKPYTQLGPRERALKRGEEALKESRLALAKTQIAVELGVEEENLNGENETEIRLAGVSHLLKHREATKTTDEPKPPERKPNDPAPSGSPPSGTSNLSPTEKIIQGLKDKPLEKRTER